MQTKDVMRMCRVTRKALQYYEDKGLLAPRVLENGYRSYSPEDIRTIKEITVLRQCGLGVEEIQSMRKQANKAAYLQKCKYLNDLHLERSRHLQACIDGLIENYDIDSAFEAMQHFDQSTITIREQLALSFPGDFGLLVAMHFGRFLQETIDTEEKRKAYTAILDYLDHVSFFLDGDLRAALEGMFPPGNIATLEQRQHDLMMELHENPAQYLEHHREEIAQYLAYKASDAYQSSATARLQRKILDFQKQSGYQEILIRNMKILSASYREYLEKTERANTVLLERFPEAKEAFSLSETNGTPT